MNGGAATVTIATEVSNDGEGDAACQVVSAILDRDGKEVATDRSETPFGIRAILFDPAVVGQFGFL